MKKTLLLLAPFFFLAPAFALTSMVCKMGKTERKVEIRYPESGKTLPCEVVYVRENGEEKVLYAAKTQAGYCQEKATEFAGGLVERGFACSQADKAPSENSTPATGPVPGPSPSR